MTGYFIAFVAGVVVCATARVAVFLELRRSRRTRGDIRVGVAAPSFFLEVVAFAVALVGLVGVFHESRAGRQPPVPLGVIDVVVVLGIAALLISQQRRRAARRRARRERARVRARQQRDEHSDSSPRGSGSLPDDPGARP